MEKLARHQASCKGLKSYITRLFNKIDDLIEKEVDSYSIALFSKAMEQLKYKGNKLDKIDEQIITLINDPYNLEGYIMESEGLKGETSDKLTTVQTFIDLHNNPRSSSPTPILPQSIESSVNPPQSDTTSQVNSEPQISASLQSPQQLDNVAT